MSDHYELSVTEELKRRRERAEEFFRTVLDPADRPYFVSDEATLHDVFVGEEADIIARCEAHYGVKLGKTDFVTPVWRLLDELERKRRRE